MNWPYNVGKIIVQHDVEYFLIEYNIQTRVLQGWQVYFCMLYLELTNDSSIQYYRSNTVNSKSFIGKG